MSEDSSSFELVDSPVMVFPANMTSTPEKPVQPNTVQQPDPAEDSSAKVREPNIEEVKVWGRAEQPGKETINYTDKPEEVGLDEIENRFRDRLKKKKLEGMSRVEGCWRLKSPGERSWKEYAFVALDLVLVGLWVLYRG